MSPYVSYRAHRWTLAAALGLGLAAPFGTVLPANAAGLMTDEPPAISTRLGGYLAGRLARKKFQDVVRILERDHRADLAGLQDGYTGKLECGLKRMGDMSFENMLGALKMTLMLNDVEHGAVLAENSEENRQIAILKMTKKMSNLGKKSWKGRERAISPYKRQKIARRAAQERWRREYDEKKKFAQQKPDE